MGERGCVLLPVNAIKFIDGDVQIHPIVDAAPGHGEPVLVGAWHVKAFDAAGLAETMFRPACVERVLRELVSAFAQTEPRRRHDDMDIAAHRAD